MNLLAWNTGLLRRITVITDKQKQWDCHIEIRKERVKSGCFCPFFWFGRQYFDRVRPKIGLTKTT